LTRGIHRIGSRRNKKMKEITGKHEEEPIIFTEEVKK